MCGTNQHHDTITAHTATVRAGLAVSWADDLAVALAAIKPGHPLIGEWMDARNGHE
jgi:hypothetical protein